jgi:hypothetical protein
MPPSNSGVADTLEVPMQPAIREILVRAYMGQVGKPFLFSAAPVFLAALYLAAVGIWFAALAAVGLGALMLGISVAVLMYQAQRGAVAADSREPTYLRTWGPLRCTHKRDDECYVATYELGEQSFVLGGTAADRLDDLLRRRAAEQNEGRREPDTIPPPQKHWDWATVDYTRRAKLILAVWDERANLVHCHPDYEPLLDFQWHGSHYD